MVTLYVTSFERMAGKTAICAGLGKRLLADGKQLGFFKPIMADTKETIDSDAAFMKRVLALAEPVEYLCPAINESGKVREAFATVSRGKDTVIVEGIYQRSTAEALNARVIVVEGYSGEVSRLINSQQDFGEHLLGVVLNKVPKSRLEKVRSEMSARLEKTGINLLGVIPEDRTLLALSIGELAGQIQGEILSSIEKSTELAENFMLGAMCVDPGTEYFGRKANKAAIVRGDRPDMQLAALETSTKCLVLSGDKAPIPAIFQRAENKKIPIILARDDTRAIVNALESALGKTRFNQEQKLPRLMQIMEQHFNFPVLYGVLGIT